MGEEALLSGRALVRKYLDLALDGKSAEYFPDEQIQAFNPENQDMDSRKVGKSVHLQTLRTAPKLKPKELVLFDDSERNCILARKAGYYAVSIDEPKVAGGDDDDDNNNSDKSKGEHGGAEGSETKDADGSEAAV